MDKKKDIIEALHEKDLNEFLKELGKYNDFVNKLILCKFCGEIISQENVYGIFLINDKAEFLCDKEACYEKFLMFQKGDKNI